MAKEQSIVDPSHPIDYTKAETPPSYTCGTCHAQGVKLWRDFQAFLSNQSLRCAPCAAAEQGKDISTIDADGLRESAFGGRTDQIGWLVPAVPTVENNAFWGYTSVPAEGVAWWRRLPTLPTK